MKRCTKIVCTLGPSTSSMEKVHALAKAGMNVARINCSHGDWDSRRACIAWVRQASADICPIAVLVDLSGPKFRLAVIPEGERKIETGEIVTIGRHDRPDVTIPIDQDEVANKLAIGDRILLGDGEIEVRICGESSGIFTAHVICGGLVKSRKGITVVGKTFDVPSLTEKDLQDIEEGAKAGADYFALSYVRDATDLRALRREIDKYDPSIRICAKIETRDALKNIDEILKVSDLIMVARGDLGLQMDIEDVPAAQKMIIEKCTEVAKPVITATQMLESMMHTARPTRAEATDVFNAILDGTDAVMLSGETAAGEFPIECVETVVRLALKAEPLYDRTRLELRFTKKSISGLSQTEAVAHSAAELAAELKASAIITTTTSGETARFVSKFRPQTPILCTTWNDKVRNQMAVIWGVEAVTMTVPKTTDECVQNSIDSFLRKDRIKVGDMVVVTAGVPAGQAGHTNLIMAEIVK